MTKVIVVHPETWEPLTVVDISEDVLRSGTATFAVYVGRGWQVSLTPEEETQTRVTRIELRLMPIRASEITGGLWLGIPHSAEHLDKLPHALLPVQHPHLVRP